MKYIIAGFVLLGLIFAGCLQQGTTSTGTGLPNPASVNCVNKGYTLEIRQGTAGEYGICKYAGWECDEWALYRGECCLQDSDCSCAQGPATCTRSSCSCAAEENETVEMPNPAAVNCENKGYTYEIRSGEAGEYGVCSYGGHECDEWALYRRECCLRDSDCICSEGNPKCANSLCGCEIPEPVETIGHSNKTVNEFLQEGLAAVNSEFYAEHTTGEFTVETYTWILGNVDMKPDQIPIMTGDLERAVLFNGEKANNLKGFAFKIYIPKDGGRPKAKGIAVFNAQTTLLDMYYANTGLDLDITFYPFSRNLYDCTMKSREYYLAGDESYITAYLFDCGDSGSFTT